MAASMPPWVPRRWAGKGQSRWSVRRVFNQQPTTCAMQYFRSSTKPPANCLGRCPRRWRDRWRHGCRHRASTDGFTACPASGEGTAPSTDLKIAKRSRDARCSRRYLIAQFWKIRRKTDHLRRCCRALARPPSRDTLQVRPCSFMAASMPPRVPGRWEGKDRSSWLVRKVLNEQRQAATRCLDSSTKPPANCLAWCPRRLRDRVAAWMPPPSLHGRIHGVSRKR
ncbi:hypothetical protein FHR50_000744 [Xanthomonas arboricola]